MSAQLFAALVALTCTLIIIAAVVVFATFGSP
jgi:hypothetical protein